MTTRCFTLAALPDIWRARAIELQRFAPSAAVAFREVADQLQEALRVAGDEALSLGQAAKESGYSVDRLRHLVADNQLPNAGKKGAPRIRRKDLPSRPSRKTPRGYNPDADARSLVALHR